MKFVLKILFYAILIFSSNLTSANNQFSVGLGLPYGGVIGGKYSTDVGNGKLYASLGLMAFNSNAGSTPGYAIGYELPVNKKTLSDF